MAKFQMTRIDAPCWANEPRINVWGITDAEYAAIQQQRDVLLNVVHQEIEAYVNDPELTYEIGDGFPSLSFLAGSYYVSDESYEWKSDSTLIVIGIQCVCLGTPIAGVAGQYDYLGLHVWLRCLPGQWASFELCGNTDSSVGG